jgi:hypothetical protein
MNSIEVAEFSRKAIAMVLTTKMIVSAAEMVTDSRLPRRQYLQFAVAKIMERVGANANTVSI